MIVGQEKICNRVDCLTLDTFPRSLMLVGAEGSGKHLIVNRISKKFGLQVIDITTNLDQESIEELYNRVEPYIYIIKVNEISVKEENTILKFLEEPLKNSYIVLLAETDIGVLPTILNRCQIWYLQNYTKECLSSFISGDNSYVLKIAKTPGQVINFCNNPINDMILLADKILDKISVASVSNTLTLSNKINFKDETSKYDLKLFVEVLLQRIVDKVTNNADPRLTSAYLLTSELQKRVRIKNLDYKAQFEKYLVELRAIMCRSC